MQPPNPPAIAVVADAHFHHLFGHYGNAGIVSQSGTMALRPFADTVRSTRVFNESGHALRHALDDIVARDIRHVVLLGDYSDDGQAETMRGLRALLDEYSARHAMRFFAVPGNHDIFGPGGRHRSKRFLNGNGGYDLVTSNPDRQRGEDDDTVVVTDSMYCAGYPDGLRALPDAGFFRTHGDLVWETPFGLDDDPGNRLYPVVSPDGASIRTLMDASYLVEPMAGVWMLMIDANVFVPLNGASGDDDAAFADSTDAGWNGMRLHKRFVLDWMKDVAARARTLGKTLVAFSHYPALDPLDDTRGDELAVLGRTGLMGRIPMPDVGEALIAAGIHVHFSGHVHVNDTARRTNAQGFLVNVAVPSLVAFPPAYKIVRAEPGRLVVETIGIGTMALDAEIIELYRAEAAKAGIEAGKLLASDNYGTFLSQHLGHLVGRRYLKREWPVDLARAAGQLTLHDLAALSFLKEPLPLSDLPAMLVAVRDDPDICQRLAASAGEHQATLSALSHIPFMAFMGDWYRVRMGSDLGLETISHRDLAAYRFLANLYRRPAIDKGSAQATFGRLVRMFEKFISGLPSRHFAIDLETGDISDLS